MAWRQTPVTTEQIVQSTTRKLANDITTLSQRKNTALNVFRQTANELGAINEDLRGSLETMGKLQEFINEQVSSTNQMISDNESVRAKILDIIGEG